MRVHYIYCHPLADSFHGAIRTVAVDALQAAGHEVDVLDLYAEDFDPVLRAEGRRHYHDTSRNRAGLESYVARLQAADALVLQFPTWCFGLPAMLKGYLDRLMMPGVAFDISDPAAVKPMLRRIRYVAGISTYGRQRWVARWVGDPPRKTVTRYLPRLAPEARTDYLALYHMNVATLATRQAFLASVRRKMARLPS